MSSGIGQITQGQNKMTQSYKIVEGTEHVRLCAWIGNQ